MPRFTTSITRQSLMLPVALAGLYLGLSACSQPASEQGAPQAEPAAQQDAPAAQAEEERFDLRGKVVSVDQEGMSLVVDHEDIPGFMRAMSMSYPVKDGTLLENLKPGEPITATVVNRGGGDYWLEDVKMATPEP